MAGELSDEDLREMERWLEGCDPRWRVAQHATRLLAAYREARTALATAHAAGVREGEQREREACAELAMEAARFEAEMAVKQRPRTHEEELYAYGAQLASNIADEIEARSSSTDSQGRSGPQRVVPDPPPRYDEVFAQGVAELFGEDDSQGRGGSGE